MPKRTRTRVASSDEETDGPKPTTAASHPTVSDDDEQPVMFAIPVTDDQLDDFVKETHELANISGLIKDLKKSDVLGKTTLHMRENFDLFYAVIVNHADVGVSTQLATFTLVVDSLRVHLTDVAKMLKDRHGARTDAYRARLAETLCMCIWLLSRLATQLQDAWNKAANSEHAQTPARGRARKLPQTAQAIAFANVKWDSMRDELLRTCARLLETPEAGRLKHMWDPPHLDQQLVVCMRQMVESALSDGNITTSDSFGHCVTILASLVGHYGAAKEIGVMVIRVCGLSHLITAPYFAEAVNEVVDKCKVAAFSDCIFDEINELTSEDFARDGIAKGVGHLVQTFAKNSPGVVLSHATTLLELLGTENSHARMSTLTAIRYLVISRAPEDMTEELTERDQVLVESMLAELKAHVCDVNAFVRARAVSEWTELAKVKRIPRDFYKEDLVQLIIDRLEDRAVTVRKQVVIFLRAVLNNNLFKDTMDEEKWESRRTKATDELNELIANDPELGFARDLRADSTAAWKAMSGVSVEHVDKFKAYGTSPLLAVGNHPEGDLGAMEEYVLVKKAPLFAALRRTIGVYVRQRQLAEEFPSEDDPIPALLRNDEHVEHTVLRPIDGELGDEEMTAYIARLLVEESLQLAVETMVQFEMAAIPLDTMKGDMLIGAYMNMACSLKKLFMQQRVDAAIMAHDEDAENDQQRVDAKEAFNDKRDKLLADLEYAVAGHKFMTQLKNVIPMIIKLFQSKSATDVIEAIRFAVQCKHFSLANAEDGIRAMLDLIWSKEASVRQHVVREFTALYLEQKADESDRRYPVRAANSLIALVVGSNEAEMASLEELVVELTKGSHITSEMIDMLFSYFMRQDEGSTTEEQSIAACRLLSMVGRAVPRRIVSNRGRFEEKLESCTNLRMARFICEALARMAHTIDMTNEKALLSEKPMQISRNADVFVMIASLVVTSAADLDDGKVTGDDGKEMVDMYDAWTPFMEQALDTIFALAQQPDRIAKEIMLSIAGIMADLLRVPGEHTPANDDEDADVVLDKIKSSKQLCARDRMLSRFLATVGHIALRLLLYIDVTFLKESKRRHAVRELHEKEKKRRSTRGGGGSPRAKKNEIEEDMLGGGTAEDQDEVTAQKMLDDEVFADDALLGVAAPIVEMVLQNRAQFSACVSVAASLALAKMMLISQSYATRHARLVFTMMCKSQCPIVRANMVVAAGDLCFRFPNLVQSYSQELYHSLDDHMHCGGGTGRRHGIDQCVRQTTLMVLTHLILNDMIKVKAMVVDVVVVLLDERPEMKALARRFFIELAGKGNALYNLLSEIIGQLSSNAVEGKRLASGEKMTQAMFEEVITFLLTFMDKAEQVANLIDRLCVRIGHVTASMASEVAKVQQYRQLAYCMAQLPAGRAAIEKMDAQSEHYAPIMYDEIVFNHFSTVVDKAKRNKKNNESILGIEEFERKLGEMHVKGADDAEVVERARNALAQKRRHERQKNGMRVSPPKPPLKSPVAAAAGTSTDEASSSARPTRASGRLASSTMHVVVKEEPVDEKEDEVVAPRRQRRRRVIADDDDDD